MTKADLAAIVQGLTPVLRDYMALVQAKDRGIDGAQGLAGPEGKPGRDGMPGIPGRDGQRGERGSDGERGLDGAAGRDGTLEELDVVQIDERTFQFQKDAANSQPLILGSVVLPVPLDRGVYQGGRTYAKGDGVTYAGSFWIAQDATSEKPGDGATKWRLAVKAGREGRAGKDGERGGPGPKGDKGDPGRNFS